ncbi:MAG TPA: thiamine-phosphate kinase [Terriglobales bacterium]|nr:thiamine-phosphate kinase [Terriglobales bacterium]
MSRYGGILPHAEKLLISRIRDRAARRRGIVTGIGDDCAILQIPPGHQTLVTTDFSLEGVHFRREWHPAEIVGHRCLTRGLSDIAAMGGNPIAVFLSLALPQALPQPWVDQFLRGLLKLADKFNVSLAGGDTAQSPDGVLADIVVVGSVPKGKAICRSGARAGDRLYVTGALGGAAATLKMLFSGRKLRPADFPRHFHPTARIEVGRFLLEKGLASAMIDLSDGLSTDLSHICEESGVGAEIHGPAIPRASIGKPSREVDLKFALHGGDDYELLFTARPGKRVPPQVAGVPITQIGHITRDKHIILLNEEGAGSELRPKGWEHFRAQI